MFGLCRLTRTGIVSLIVIIVAAGGIAVWKLFEAPETRQTVTELSRDVVSSPSYELQTDTLTRFAGSDRCAECHAEVTANYHSSGMGQSMCRIGSETPLEDYDQHNSFSPDGRHYYSIVRTAEGVFHHERLADIDGKTVYDQAVKIEFVVGSGTQGRSYLFNRNGMLYMSPIGWYASGGKWDLSPGFKLPFHRRFSRRVPSECLECHSGQMNLTSRTDVFDDPPFREIAIGCERCHGPGVNHIEFHQREESVGSDPIINPSRLDPGRREDVCTQCHLSGEGRFLRDGSNFDLKTPT
jgi:hypothetical protein